MKPSIVMRAFILTVTLGLAQGAIAQDPASSAQGTWEALVPDSRPLMFWEELKGYRLFFDPDDAEPLRRLLTVAVPVDHVLTEAWAVIRPVHSDDKNADAWLRVEGVPGPDSVKIQWDGTYRGERFPDGPYFFEIHIRWKPAEERDWTVVVLKSKDYPLFDKIGGESVGDHPLLFKQGQFEPYQVSASFSKAVHPSLPVLARVYAPSLEGAFSVAGITVQGRMVEDAQGKPVQSDWICLCQQPLPGDSPARLKAKKVRCDWDLSGVEPGLWDLRLGLYHDINSRSVVSGCDVPILDEDRLRVAIAP